MNKVVAEPHLIIKVQELAQHDGERLTISGAVHKVRRFGGLYFIVIRDGQSLIQCKIEPENSSILAESYTEGNYVVATAQKIWGLTYWPWVERASSFHPLLFTICKFNAIIFIKLSQIIL